MWDKTFGILHRLVYTLEQILNPEQVVLNRPVVSAFPCLLVVVHTNAPIDLPAVKYFLWCNVIGRCRKRRKFSKKTETIQIIYKYQTLRSPPLVASIHFTEYYTHTETHLSNTSTTRHTGSARSLRREHEFPSDVHNGAS